MIPSAIPWFSFWCPVIHLPYLPTTSRKKSTIFQNSRSCSSQFDGFHKDFIGIRQPYKAHRFTGLPQLSQRTGWRTGADKRFRMYGKLLHTRFIPKILPLLRSLLGSMANTASLPFRMHADRIHLWMYSFPHRNAWYQSDQELPENGRHFSMISCATAWCVQALRFQPMSQPDSNSDIAFHNTFYKLCYWKLAFLGFRFKWDSRMRACSMPLLTTSPLVFFTIFRMFHS